MKAFIKIINPGRVRIYGRLSEVFIKIKLTAGGRLTISGVEGPWHSGNCAGSCGQIVDRLENIVRRHKGWSRDKLNLLREYWDKWHLNDIRAGCEHQDEWDVSKMLALPDGKTERAGWVYPAGHPEGLLCKPCPVCGYKYGSAWTKRDVPEGVLRFLCELPETKNTPAWV